MVDRELQDKARKVLEGHQWGKSSIRRALDPTPNQADERSQLPVADLNPEQGQAIQWLRREGWPFEDIAKAIPVPIGEVARFIGVHGWLDEFLPKLEVANKRSKKEGYHSRPDIPEAYSAILDRVRIVVQNAADVDIGVIIYSRDDDNYELRMAEFACSWKHAEVCTFQVFDLDHHGSWRYSTDEMPVKDLPSSMRDRNMSRKLAIRLWDYARTSLKFRRMEWEWSH